MLAKRTSIEIVQEILRMQGKKKTHIMYETSLTYPQTIRYLQYLTERGLIEVGSDLKGKQIYLTTQTGQELLRHLDVAMQYLGLGESREISNSRAG